MRTLLLILVTLLFCPAASFAQWKVLEPGLEYGTFALPKKSRIGDSKAHVLRIDPTRFEFVLLTAKEIGPSRSAGDWIDDHKLVAGINAGMFATDGLTNVGHMSGPGFKNNRRFNVYKSVFAFAPKRKELPSARMYDLDVTDRKDIQNKYAGIIQNLRLIKRPGENRWSKQPRKWSEAMVAQDGSGNILFVFTRTPYTMFDLNNMLLALPLDIRCAQHVEGGPEASMVIRHPRLKREFIGSFETGFNEGDTVSIAWPIPNVIGVRAKRQ